MGQMTTKVIEFLNDYHHMHSYYETTIKELNSNYIEPLLEKKEYGKLKHFFHLISINAVETESFSLFLTSLEQENILYDNVETVSFDGKIEFYLMKKNEEFITYFDEYYKKQDQFLDNVVLPLIEKEEIKELVEIYKSFPTLSDIRFFIFTSIEDKPFYPLFQEQLMK